jgi:uncharacterized protein (TIGR03437 family)
MVSELTAEFCMIRVTVMRMCSALLLLTASLGNAETVTVRSGNGSVGGMDSSVTFLLGPADSDFNHIFTQSDVSSAQSGPAAFILNRNPLWITGLSTDGAAQWIGTNASASSLQGNTALYAVSFTISSQFASAVLDFHYAVDDALGSQVNGGIYLNGAAVCANLIANGSADFTQEHLLTCNDVGSHLRTGTNWLYIDAVNLEGPAGLLFSATITTAIPQLMISGIGNSAAYSPGSSVAPGSIATVMGSFLSVSTSIAPPGQPWPTSLAGLSMSFGGIQAPLYYVSPAQVNLQVPWELGANTNTIATATIGAQASASQTLYLAPFSPGLFSMNAEGNGQGAILNSQYLLVDSSNPASLGDVIQIYCTGLGAVTNQPATGALTPVSPLSKTTTTPVVTIGGAAAPVLFSGLAPGTVGLYQIDAQIPTGIATGPAVPVMVSSGGVTSNAVTLAIQPFPNPQPAITGLSPSSATVGTGPLTLTISGTGFIAASTVMFNGVPHLLSSVGSNQLRMNLSASDLAAVGTFPLIVNNPPPGGGNSQSVNFTVTAALNPQPSITGLSPTSATVSSGLLVLTINGSGFIGSSTVTFNGILHPALLVNSGQLTITLTASDLSATGNCEVVVSNPLPGGGTSTATFTITPSTSGNPQPLITSLSPASSGAGGGPLTLDITGSGFIASSSLTFNGTPKTVSFANSGLLITTLATSDLSVAGNFAVVVTNPPPGGGKSNAATFSIIQETLLTGDWSGTWSAVLGAKGTVTATLKQTGSTIGGTISPIGWCFSAGVVSGTIGGNQVSLNMTFGGGQEVAFSGTSNASGTALVGQYTVVSGSCVDGSTGGLALGR